MKSKFVCHIATTIAPSAIIGLLLTMLAGQVYSQTQPVCNALTTASNQIYLVAADGTVLTQFPTDGKSKFSISLSPDGSKIAYLSDDNQNAFTVANTIGRTVTIPVSSAGQGPLIGVSWDSTNVLKAQYHISPTNSLFQFFAVPEHFTNPLTMATRPIVGANCVTQVGEDHKVACLSDDKLMVDKKVIVDLDPLSASNVTQITSGTVPVGSSFTTQSAPSFQVKVVDISDGVTMQVTLPNGHWSRSRIPVGQALPILWDEDTYGFIPVSVDNKKGLVTISVVKSNNSADDMSSAVVWSPDNHVTMMVQGSNGTQLFVIKSHANEAPMTDLRKFMKMRKARRDGADGKDHMADQHNPAENILTTALNISDPVTSINYDTPTLLMIKTRSQFLSIPINKVDARTSSLQVGAMTTLPTSMNIKLPSGSVVKAGVVDWACH